MVPYCVNHSGNSVLNIKNRDTDAVIRLKINNYFHNFIAYQSKSVATHLKSKPITVNGFYIVCSVIIS